MTHYQQWDRWERECDALLAKLDRIGRPQPVLDLDDVHDWQRAAAAATYSLPMEPGMALGLADLIQHGLG